MALSTSITLTISDYDIKMSRSLKFYKNDALKLVFTINYWGIDNAHGVSQKTLMPLEALSAILFMETPGGTDSVEAGKVEGNVVTFYLDSEYTQNVGVSRMQIRLFDDDGCAITLPEFPFEIKENIYGADVKFSNVVLMDSDGNAIVTEDLNQIDVGDVFLYGVEPVDAVVLKEIRDLPLKEELELTDSLILQDDEGTKRGTLENIAEKISNETTVYLEEAINEFNNNANQQLENNQQSIDNFIEETQTQVDEVLSDANQINQKIAETNAQLLQKANKVDLEIERERINQLAKLESGSTTADAELIDIRIGNDGKTYTSAGDAVRSQFKNVANGVGINNGVLDPLKISGSKVGINKFNPHTITQGYQLNAETGELYDTNASGYVVSDYIPVVPSQDLTILKLQSDLQNYIINGCDRVVLYDENKNWLIGWKTLTTDTVIHHDEMAYLRFSYYKANDDGLEVALRLGIMVVDKNEFPPPYNKDSFIKYDVSLNNVNVEYSEKSSISEHSSTCDVAESSLSSEVSTVAYEVLRKNRTLHVFEQNNMCQTIDEELEVAHINAPLSSGLSYIAMRIHDIDKKSIEENYLVINYEHILGDTIDRFGVRATQGNWGTGYNHIGELKQGVNIVDLQSIIDNKPDEFVDTDLVHISLGVGNLTQDTEYKISARLLPKTMFIHNHVIAHQLLGFNQDDYYNKSEIDKKIGGGLTSDWESKVIATYGDSITAIGNGNGVNLGWQKYVCEYYNFSQHYGRGIGGQRLVWNSATWWANPDGTYNSREESGGTQPDGTTTHLGSFCSWDRITTMFSDEIKDSIDLIIVKGGTNDSVDSTTTNLQWIEGESLDTHWNNASENVMRGDYNINTFKGGIASTIMKLQARCPNAVIVFATPLSGRGTQGENGTMLVGDEYEKAQIIKEICAKFSVPVIDVFGTCGINPLNRTEYIADGVHPYSEKGKKMLSRAIIMGLKTILPKQE